MLCGGTQKRKSQDASEHLLWESPHKARSLLSPLKSLKLSPIVKCSAENYNEPRCWSKSMALRGKEYTSSSDSSDSDTDESTWTQFSSYEPLFGHMSMLEITRRTQQGKNTLDVSRRHREPMLDVSRQTLNHSTLQADVSRNSKQRSSKFDIFKKLKQHGASLLDLSRLRSKRKSKKGDTSNLSPTRSDIGRHSKSFRLSPTRSETGRHSKSFRVSPTRSDIGGYSKKSLKKLPAQSDFARHSKSFRISPSKSDIGRQSSKSYRSSPAKSDIVRHAKKLDVTLRSSLKHTSIKDATKKSKHVSFLDISGDSKHGKHRSVLDISRHSRHSRTLDISMNTTLDVSHVSTLDITQRQDSSMCDVSRRSKHGSTLDISHHPSKHDVSMLDVSSMPKQDLTLDVSGVSNLDVSRKSHRDKDGLKAFERPTPYLGQLKLSVYINCGLLTIHVIQARHLTSQSKPTCDSFIKLSLYPDDSRRTKCKTDVVYDTNHPLYDEKFSFELLDEDMCKRLLISVWNKDLVSGKKEFLGCMSFGIQHIQSQKKTINGWYYLLQEDVGKHKHLQAASRKQHLMERGQQNIPTVNKDLLFMDPHSLVVRRGTTGGFDFSMAGCSPVTICKVTPGGAADTAGLQVGDCIVRINGQNVSRSTSDSIGRIVRHSATKIILDIQRPRKVETLTDSPAATRKPLSSTMVSDPDITSPAAPKACLPVALHDKESNSNKVHKIKKYGSLSRKRVTFKDFIL